MTAEDSWLEHDLFRKTGIHFVRIMLENQNAAPSGKRRGACCSLRARAGSVTSHHNSRHSRSCCSHKSTHSRRNSRTERRHRHKDRPSRAPVRAPRLPDPIRRRASHRRRHASCHRRHANHRHASRPRHVADMATMTHTARHGGSCHDTGRYRRRTESQGRGHRKCCLPHRFLLLPPKAVDASQRRTREMVAGRSQTHDQMTRIKLNGGNVAVLTRVP